MSFRQQQIEQPPAFVGLETLEDRQLLSSTVTAVINKTGLVINGTAGNDTIRVAQVGKILQVQVSDGTAYQTIFSAKVASPKGKKRMHVNVSADATRKKKKPKGKSGGVDTIFITGDTGDDNLFIMSNVRTRAFIYGNEGDDNMMGGAGNDIISGGDGDDGVFGGRGNDKLFGDAGVDALGGEEGDDILVGGPDPDSLFGNDGDDIIDARDGNAGDVPVGGLGDDVLYADYDIYHVPEGVPAAYHGCEAVVDGDFPINS